jgi:hypothetical protein
MANSRLFLDNWFYLYLDKRIVPDFNLKNISLVVTLLAFTLLLVVFLPDRNFPSASGFDNNSQGASGYFWLALEPVTGGFSSPTGVTNGGDGRLFVTERTGLIRIVENGQLLPVPFLDIQGQVGSVDNWEQGLLGLAFHPDYVNNGLFFVNYINLDGDTHLSRFQVSDGYPNLADLDSEVVVLFIDQPTIIHNGGGLAFGPDGYLYASLGDGGWLNDPENQAQNKQLLLGKILRLDVSTGNTAPFYTVPADNPFVNEPGPADEIWALGFRNPWRITFDSQTGDLFIGDVGNFYQEEIDFQEAGDPGGNNYGWRCYEGNVPFIQTGCGPASQYTFPIHADRHRGHGPSRPAQRAGDVRACSRSCWRRQHASAGQDRHDHAGQPTGIGVRRHRRRPRGRARRCGTTIEPGRRDSRRPLGRGARQARLRTA